MLSVTILSFCCVSFCHVSFCCVSFCHVSFCHLSFCHLSFCNVSFCLVSFCRMSRHLLHDVTKRGGTAPLPLPVKASVATDSVESELQFSSEKRLERRTADGGSENQWQVFTFFSKIKSQQKTQRNRGRKTRENVAKVAAKISLTWVGNFSLRSASFRRSRVSTLNPGSRSSSKDPPTPTSDSPFRNIRCTGL